MVAQGLRILKASRSTRGRRAHQELESSGALSVPLDELAATFAHVWVNRVLRSAHRAQEYVIYDFLDRLYAAEEGRSGRG